MGRSARDSRRLDCVVAEPVVQKTVASRSKKRMTLGADGPGAVSGVSMPALDSGKDWSRQDCWNHPSPTGAAGLRSTAHRHRETPKAAG